MHATSGEVTEDARQQAVEVGGAKATRPLSARAYCALLLDDNVGLHFTAAGVLVAFSCPCHSAIATHVCHRGFDAWGFFRTCAFWAERVSDGVPDPAPREILYPQQIFDRLFGQAATNVGLGDGLLVFRTAFEVAPRGTTDVPNRAIAAPRTIRTELPAPPTPPQAHTGGTSSYPRVLQYIGAAAAAILLVLLVLSHFGRPAQPDDSRHNTPDSITTAPKVLAVTETEKMDGRSRALRERDLVPTVADTAITFGKNPRLSSYVAEAIPSIGAEEHLGVMASRGFGAHVTKEVQL